MAALDFFCKAGIICLSAGIAQLVEHNLAKVGVASSSLVSRKKGVAEWQSGYASACKAADTGSIPVSAFKKIARVAELVDARDLKSLEVYFVPVRVRPWAWWFVCSH